LNPTVDTAVSTRWDDLATRVLEGGRLSDPEALSVLTSDDADLLGVLHAAFRVRRAHFGVKVKLNMLINAKSGICPEDCGYCSQSRVSSAPIAKYRMLSEEVLVAGAHEA
jgi:biotin synthase